MEISFLSQKNVLLIIYSLCYNLLLQIIYRQTRSGKFAIFDIPNSKEVMHPNLVYLFVIGDAIALTGMFFYFSKILTFSFIEIAILMLIFSLGETLYMEIKMKYFSLKRAATDLFFIASEIIGTYFIFSYY